MSTLVIAEHDNGSLKGATLNAVAAAQAMGSDIDILVGRGPFVDEIDRLLRDAEWHSRTGFIHIAVLTTQVTLLRDAECVFHCHASLIADRPANRGT